MTIGTIIAFYAIFFVLGISASHWLKAKPTTSDLLLAGRRLPLWLATLTLIATWVGGGYIVGTAEAVYDPQLGLLWTQAPWCFALSLVLGGVFFARPMRQRRCATMLDLFDQRYGPRMAGALYLPALLAELFWIAAILSALGTVFATILELNPPTAILVSAAVALAYTLAGGLWAVALTDALQLVCIIIGLALVLPYALESAGGWQAVVEQYEATHPTTFRVFSQTASLTMGEKCRWIDTALLLILGGIPWQVYFQRVLACRSDRAAIWLSIIAGIGCLLLAAPSVLIGMIGSTVDWQALAGTVPDGQSILPFVMRYMTPPAVAVLGLCAISAAVMSSIDSSMLSGASMFAWNVYRPLRPRAKDEQLKLVMRATMILIGTAAAFLAIQVRSVYNLWYLSADLVYVILFPQLISALFDRRSNGVGAAWGAGAGFLLRIAGGESSIGIPALLETPEFVPFRTSVMLSSMAIIWSVSRLTQTPNEDA